MARRATWRRVYTTERVVAACADCDWRSESAVLPTDRDGNIVNRRALKHSARKKHRVVVTIERVYSRH